MKEVNIKKFNHKTINGISIHNIDVINNFIKNGWILKSINYCDNATGYILRSRYWSNSMIAKFIKPINNNFQQ
jgi:predicted AAA+ superfamily ATPase